MTRLHHVMHTIGMILKRINRNVEAGVRWARTLALVLGLIGCTCVLIVVWQSWGPLTPVTIIFGLLAAACAASYLRMTR